jgi:hypothetical protein
VATGRVRVHDRLAHHHARGGTYRLALGIIDPWRNRPRIRFANNLPVVNGWTVLEQVRVV